MAWVTWPWLSGWVYDCGTYVGPASPTGSPDETLFFQGGTYDECQWLIGVPDPTNTNQPYNTTSHWLGEAYTSDPSFNPAAPAWFHDPFGGSAADEWLDPSTSSWVGTPPGDLTTGIYHVWVNLIRYDGVYTTQPTIDPLSLVPSSWLPAPPILTTGGSGAMEVTGEKGKAHFLATAGSPLTMAGHASGTMSGFARYIQTITMGGEGGLLPKYVPDLGDSVQVDIEVHLKGSVDAL